MIVIPFQDSLPPLHTLREEDVVEVIPSFSDQTLTISLKNRTAYVYDPIDWDFEDHYPSTIKRIKDAIHNLQRTFTKMEQEPAVVGGDSAWNQYIIQFCTQHQRPIKRHGPAEIWVQFVVHLKGQIVDLQVISNPSNNDNLAQLAIQAIKDGPPWQSAVQNGRKVVAYKKQLVKLSL
jgi:hypothetical protein